MAKPLTYYAHTVPGVEEIAWLEIRDQLPGAEFVETLFAQDSHGIVVFRYDGPMQALRHLRTIEQVFVQALAVELATRQYAELYKISELIAKSADFKLAVDRLMQFQREQRQGGAPTFRVVSQIYGRFPFRIRNLTTSILKGVSQRYPHWQPTQQNPRVEIHASLLGSRFLCGLYLPSQVQGGFSAPEGEAASLLRPSAAAAMIQLSEPAADEVCLDPVCGEGVLLQARRLFGPYRQMIGSDVSAPQLEQARQRLVSQRKERPSDVLFAQCDAATLPLPAASVHKVLLYLPGKSLPHTWLNGLLGELARVLRSGGRVVLFSYDYERVKDALRNHETLSILTGYSIAPTRSKWGRVYIIERWG